MSNAAAATPDASVETPAETVKRARQTVVESRAGHYLSGCFESTRLLERAHQDLLSLLPAIRLETLPTTQRHEMRDELILLSAELSRADAIHRQAGSLTAEWARVFTEATFCEPAASYSPEGLPELVATHLEGRLEWEA